MTDDSVIAVNHKSHMVHKDKVRSTVMTMVAFTHGNLVRGLVITRILMQLKSQSVDRPIFVINLQRKYKLKT